MDNPTLNFDVLNIYGLNVGHYDLSFQASTAVAVEGAYFMNKYVGLGGRLRVKSTPIKGWNNLLNAAQDYMNLIAEDIMDENILKFDDFISSAQFTIESDHLTEFAADMGLYFNIPLSRRFSLGTKALVGHSVMQELDLDAHFSGHIYDFKYDAVILNGELQLDKLQAHVILIRVNYTIASGTMQRWALRTPQNGVPEFRLPTPTSITSCGRCTPTSTIQKKTSHLLSTTTGSWLKPLPTY